MTTDTRQTYAADFDPAAVDAAMRHGRKLRSDAFRDAGRAVATWFKGLTTSSTADAKAPRGGRTA